jgi:hypothetical protein
LFEGIRKHTAKVKARRKIAVYEKLHRSSNPLPRPTPIQIEPAFDVFVEQFGGEKISDLIFSKSQMPLNADYFFRQQNVIAELKTLEGVYSGPNGFKALAQAYIDSGCGTDLMSLIWGSAPMPQRVRDLIGKRLRRAIEQRIKKARKQLRHSKATFGNGATRTLILIAMDQSPLFGHSTMILTLAKMMGDNYSDEFTDGVVYLNPNTPTKMKHDGMEFSGWYPFYRDDGINSELSGFVNLLGNRWLTYYGNLIGQRHPILKLDSPDEMLHVLRGP